MIGEDSTSHSLLLRRRAALLAGGLLSLGLRAGHLLRGAALQDAGPEVLPPLVLVLVAPLVGALVQGLSAGDNLEPGVVSLTAGGPTQVAFRDDALLPQAGCRGRHHQPDEKEKTEKLHDVCCYVVLRE